MHDFASYPAIIVNYFGKFQFMMKICFNMSEPGLCYDPGMVVVETVTLMGSDLSNDQAK